MTRASFYKLLMLLKPHISRGQQQKTKYRRATIPPDVRLDVSLRILSGGEVSDIVQILSRVQLYTMFFHDTVRVLEKMLQFPTLSKSQGELEKVARCFKLFRSQVNPLDGFVVALDRICINMPRPSKESNPASLFCRKGYYAIPVQALCDSNYIFLYASARSQDATYDVLANAVSGSMKVVGDGLLGEYFSVVGDESYPVSEHIIVLFPASTITEDEDNFNFYLSSLRFHIEHAFDILIARWRILRDRLDFSLEHCTSIMAVCMKLHNFCITENSIRGRRG